MQMHIKLRQISHLITNINLITMNREHDKLLKLIYGARFGSEPKKSQKKYFSVCFHTYSTGNQVSDKNWYLLEL